MRQSAQTTIPVSLLINTKVEGIEPYQGERLTIKVTKNQSITILVVVEVDAWKSTSTLIDIYFKKRISKRRNSGSKFYLYIGFILLSIIVLLSWEKNCFLALKKPVLGAQVASNKHFFNKYCSGSLTASLLSPPNPQVSLNSIFLVHPASSEICKCLFKIKSFLVK